MRNPYLEAFSKYVELADMPWGEKEWEPVGGGILREVAVESQRVTSTFNTYTAKYELQRRCAWAVPNEPAIRAIVDLGMSVVEIGAGSGYWAWMLANEGVQVAAFDSQPNDENHWCEPDHWFPVLEGDHHVLADGHYADRALMLCWPPYDSDMALDCLMTYGGNVLIFIGEGSGGCTANDAFFQALGEGYWDDDREEYVEDATSAWHTETEVAIPQWPGLHDSLTIFRRSQ